MTKFNIKFPLETQNGKLRKIDSHEKIEQAIKMVLSTYPGERWSIPNYGSKLFDYLFKPDSLYLRSCIRTEIETVLKKWISGIEIEKVEIELNEPSSGKLLVAIRYGHSTSDEIKELSINVMTTVTQ
ncbi:MAG: hypothetical protein Kow00108_13800 [Calditrichia bacterium]